MIAILGGNGGIGRRYQAILRALKAPFQVIDLGDDEIEDIEFDKAIIATPTQTHFDFCERLITMEKPFLCEKPLSKQMKECNKIWSWAQKKGVPAFVVNNYQFAINHFSEIKKIEYDFFNTGKDGLIWDLCQLIYIAHKKQSELIFKTQSFWWDFKINGEQIPYHNIEMSYYEMIENFIEGNYTHLWTAKQGSEMTDTVIHWEGKIENNLGRSSSKRLKKTS